MKNLRLLLLCFLLISCSSIRVFTDFDSSIDFSNYSSFAFFKPGIEQVEISDLDKRRILKAIEKTLTDKQLRLEEDPDLLVNISVKATDQVIVNSTPIGWGAWGWGWGWNPWLWGVPNTRVSTQTRGELFIDLIDAKTKLLVWQGKGSGGISEYSKNRDERINIFVSEILKNFPPVLEN